MRPLPATQAASLCPRVSGSAWWAGNVWHLELDAPCQLLTVAGGPLFRGPGCTSACVITKGHLCATQGALAFGLTDTAGISLWTREHDEWARAIKEAGWGAGVLSFKVQKH